MFYTITYTCSASGYTDTLHTRALNEQAARVWAEYELSESFECPGEHIIVSIEEEEEEE